MADNTPITAGSGTVIATDDIGSGVQCQRVKLVASADGSAEALSKAEDAAHVSGDHGFMLLAVRKDSGVPFGADGDYTPLQTDASGNLRVTIAADVVGSNSDGDNDAIVTLNTKTLANGATSLTPKFAKIAAASNGNNTLVSAVALKKLRVLALTLSFSGSVNGKLQTAAGGTDLTGLFYGAVNVVVTLPFNPLGWCETVAGELLNLNLSGATAVGGCLTYVEV